MYEQEAAWPPQHEIRREPAEYRAADPDGDRQPSRHRIRPGHGRASAPMRNPPTIRIKRNVSVRAAYAAPAWPARADPGHAVPPLVTFDDVFQHVAGGLAQGR